MESIETRERTEAPENRNTESTSNAFLRELDSVASTQFNRSQQTSDSLGLPGLQVIEKNADEGTMQKCIDQSCNKARDRELRALKDEIGRGLSELPKEAQLKFQALQKQDQTKSPYSDSAIAYMKSLGSHELLEKMRRANETSQIVY